MTEEEIFNNLLKRNPTPGAKNTIIFDNDGNFVFPGWISGSTSPTVVSRKGGGTRGFYIKNNINGQILYDIYILGLTDISNRPRCPICGKLCKFVDFVFGYAETCRNKDCIKELHRRQTTDLWKTKEYSEKVISSVHEAYKNPQVQENFLKAVRSEEYRKRRSKIAKEIYEKGGEELKIKMSNTTKNLWKDKDFKQAQIILRSGEEYKNKMKAAAIKRWSDDSFRIKMSEKMKSEEVKQKRSKSILKLYQNNEYKNKHRQSLRESFDRRLEDHGGDITEVIPTLGGVTHVHETYFSKKFNERLRYDSSWERKFITFCENCDDISSVSRIKDPIIYVYENYSHRYYPDFLIIYKSQKFVIEIKPLWQIKQEVVKIKIDTAKKFYGSSDIKYVVLSEDSLFTKNYRKSEIDEELLTTKLTLLLTDNDYLEGE